jgi:hypothetical protein
MSTGKYSGYTCIHNLMNMEKEKYEANRSRQHIGTYSSSRHIRSHRSPGA